MPVLILWWLAPLGALAALVGAWHCGRRVLRSPADGEVAKTTQLTEAGLGAWTRRQGRFFLTVLAAVFLALLLMAFGLRALSRIVPFAFLSGALLSALCNFLGTRLAVSAAPRAAAAARQSPQAAWRVILGAAAAAGLAAAGLSLLDLCAWFAGLYWLAPRLGLPLSLPEITVVLLSSVLGAGLQALFARLAGGMFSGAAGIGAELLARSEPSVPEEDPRNPAVAASRVARLVAGVGGAMADLFAAHSLALAAAAVLGVAAFGARRAAPELQLAAAVLPLGLAGAGAALSLAWVLAASAAGSPKPARLRASLYQLTAICAAALALLAAGLVALALPRASFGLWGAVVAGLAAGAVLAKAAGGALPAGFDPARNALAAGEPGATGARLRELAAGLRSASLPLGALVVALLAAFFLAGGSVADPASGFLGVGLAAAGTLSLAGTIGTALACGPVATGVREACPQGGAVEGLKGLEAVGRPLAGTARGLAAAAGGLAALAAIPAGLEALRASLGLEALGAVAAGPAGSAAPLIRKVSELGASDLLDRFGIAPANPMLLAGMLLGALAVGLFAALAAEGSGRAAVRLADECRRQWRMIPGLSVLKPEARPDPAACVRVTTGRLNREMLLPGALALALPASAGLLLGAAGATGFAAGTLIVGLPLALFLGGWGPARDPLPAAGDPAESVSRDLGAAVGSLIRLSAVIAVATAGLTVKLAGTGSLLTWLGAALTGLAN